jgi:hypothetical protein
LFYKRRVLPLGEHVEAPHGEIEELRLGETQKRPCSTASGTASATAAGAKPLLMAFR